MITIKIIPAAEKDIIDIYNHILHQYKAPTTARRFLDGIYEEVKKLEILPNRGAKYGKQYRKIMYKKHRIIYRYNEEENAVYIIAVE